MKWHQLIKKSFSILFNGAKTFSIFTFKVLKKIFTALIKIIFFLSIVASIGFAFMQFDKWFMIGNYNFPGLERYAQVHEITLAMFLLMYGISAVYFILIGVDMKKYLVSYIASIRYKELKEQYGSIETQAITASILQHDLPITEKSVFAFEQKLKTIDHGLSAGEYIAKIKILGFTPLAEDVDEQEV